MELTPSSTATSRVYTLNLSRAWSMAGARWALCPAPGRPVSRRRGRWEVGWCAALLEGEGGGGKERWIGQGVGDGRRERFQVSIINPLCLEPLPRRRAGELRSARVVTARGGGSCPLRVGSAWRWRCWRRSPHPRCTAGRPPGGLPQQQQYIYQLQDTRYKNPAVKHTIYTQ